MRGSEAPPPLKKHRRTPIGQRSCSVLGRKVQQKTRTASKARLASSATANTEPNGSEEQERHRRQNEASNKAALGVPFSEEREVAERQEAAGTAKQRGPAVQGPAPAGLSRCAPPRGEAGAHEAGALQTAAG